MSGKSAFGGLLLLALGAAGGWYFHDWSARRDPMPPVEETPPLVAEAEPPAPEKVEPTPPPANPLEQAFKDWSSAPELAGALIGYCVFDGEGKLLYGSPLAETALCPASALKTVTAGAAFGLLGPDFRFRTEVLAAGGISPAGTTTGDLVLKGGGDPTLSAEDLDVLAAQLAEKGLKRVEGSLKSDASVFPAEPVNEHWNWGDIGNAYGTGAYGLNVDHNVMSLWFDPGVKEGEPAKFGGSIPALGKTRWDVRVATGPVGSGDGVSIFSSPYAEVVQVRGTVPLGEKGFTVRGSVPNPPKLAEEIFRAALVKRGVTFGGRPHAVEETVPLAAHLSAPLPEIIDHMQLVSDNLEAQSLFLTMGRRADAPAAQVVKEYWEKAGVRFTGLRLIDGSGLARATMITPVDLARVNIAALKGPDGARYLQSLPGSSDGTLKAKRGAMSGVKTEVGFIIRDGKTYPFALMANGLGANVDFWKLRMSLLESIGQ
ncbi:D-alanyl-D-alanine carboxypeptidase/D-alanyl-D-alanine-endopeptidase [Luteolibacter sp. SL250]|uniref:D-alanyl-D-alanine carboxypeptidase/D-alanyl-D-alanine endopeptidase n=1 Tax=Luteolibacter sp. SL250 TaxID=2995170 RepID=UPI00227084DB|nr:D-alanyl-D-alanine carboxypeptidase/D-alanyl-D-alanine-endopeptidase [Luteolibacter sp. SL250]WAC20003.1 D-alanyl-D-alanine carboxypeptidase/D-alanyl-D-alanine-endopeptidase [Luteolibacter sp. SL250]